MSTILLRLKSLYVKKSLIYGPPYASPPPPKVRGVCLALDSSSIIFGISIANAFAGNYSRWSLLSDYVCGCHSVYPATQITHVQRPSSSLFNQRPIETL